jgi:predicted dehydrogenase
MALRTIHVGVGGRGVWPLQLMPRRGDYRPVALVDTRPERLAQARQLADLGEAACFSALEDALGAVAADAVVVITPPDFHAKHCHLAVQAGKHVLVEKPFAKDLSTAGALVRAADQAGVRIAVCQNKRFGAVYRTLGRLIRQGDLGAPAFGLMSVSGWRPGVHHSGLDRHAYLWERGIHDLDTLRYVLDARPRRVWAHSFNPPWSPYAGGGGFHGWIEFDGGISFGMMCTFAGRGKGSSLRIECREGALELRGDTLEVLRSGAAQPEALPLDPGPDSETALLDGFRRYVLEGVEPEFSGRENLATVALVECLGAAADRGEVLDFDEYVAERLGGL